MRAPLPWALLLSLSSLPMLAACGDDSDSTMDGSEDGAQTESGDDGGDGDASDGMAGDGTDPDAPAAAPFDCDGDSGDWDAASQQLECELIERVNAQRAEGADCLEMGAFEPVDALEAHAVLMDNARAHSQDMIDNDYFAHEGLDGTEPFDWALAGYGEAGARIELASGHATAEATVEALMESATNCANLMTPTSRHIGVGYADGEVTGPSPVWTIITAD